MKNILVVINQKGGVGKSTTTLALGAGLIEKGERVLYVDLDAQGNLSDTLGVTPDTNGLLELLQKRQKPEDRATLIAGCIQQISLGSAIASSPLLASADITVDGVGKEMRLKEMLEPLQELYDYILIDTPPALGIITVNALTAATTAVIPAQADAYSLHGIGQLYDTLETVREYTNPDLQVSGIVLTRYNGRSILSREVADSMKSAAKTLGTKLCKTRIRECIALKEAQAQRCDIFRYAPRSNAAEDYRKLLTELLGEG